LVANPLSSRSVNIKEVQQTSTNSRKGSTADEERLVEASSSNKTSTDNSGESDRENKRQVTNTTARRRSVVNRLEVDGDVVDGEEERTGKDESKGAHNPDGAVLEDADRNHGSLTLNITGDGPDDGDGDPSNEQTDNNRGVPSVSLSTVLNSENIRDGEAHHQNNSKGVHLKELLKKRGLDGNSSTGSLEEQEDDAGRESSDGEVDVETPSPRDVVSEGTTKERSNDTGDTVGGANDTSESRSLLRRSRETDDGVSAST
jgi:hypothetical protein